MVRLGEVDYATISNLSMSNLGGAPEIRHQRFNYREASIGVVKFGGWGPYPKPHLLCSLYSDISFVAAPRSQFNLLDMFLQSF